MLEKQIERKYQLIRYEPERLKEVMQELTDKINKLNDEYEVVEELYSKSLKFKY